MTPPDSPPNYEAVEIKRARKVIDEVDSEDAPLPVVEEPGCLGVALVRGGESHPSTSIALDEIAKRLTTGNVSPEDGIGHGYVPLEGRRIVNVGVFTYWSIADLRTRGFRMYQTSSTQAYGLIVIVPPSDPPQALCDRDSD